MKKIVALLLTIALVVSMSAVAFAVPSKSTSDMTKVKTVTAKNGATVASNFAVEIAKDTPETIAALADIAAKIADGSATLEAFGTDVKAEVEALLPAGTDVSKLNLNEFVTIKTANYDKAYGAMSVSFTVASSYVDGQSVVALVMVKGKWVAVPAVVQNGEIVIDFPEDILEAINGQDVALAIFG